MALSATDISTSCCTSKRLHFEVACTPPSGFTYLTIPNGFSCCHTTKWLYLLPHYQEASLTALYQMASVAATLPSGFTCCHTTKWLHLCHTTKWLQLLPHYQVASLVPHYQVASVAATLPSGFSCCHTDCTSSHIFKCWHFCHTSKCHHLIMPHFQVSPLNYAALQSATT